VATAHVLQHAATEGPGRIAGVARELGLGVALHELFAGARVPEALPDGDVLVVMGGSMGVGDLGDDRWPFLEAEAKLLARVLRHGAPVLGVCLGAQLMAHALGARVFPLEVGSPAVRLCEVGWGAVTFVAPPGSEPALAGLDASEVVLHWHGDTFDLPEGATLLASTLVCPHQMFRYGAKSFAVQFHVEVDAADVPTWVREDASFVQTANGPQGGARIVAETARLAPRVRQTGDRLIRNMLAVMLGRSSNEA
jgi:GMP synthase (glutamine-hydrolysing)